MKRKRPIWRRHLALGLALVAFAVPASLASGGVPSDSSPPAGAFDSGVPGGGYIPDVAVPRPGSADAFESGIPGGGYVPASTTTVVIPAPEPTGFDWTTVAVGLGAGVAGLLAGAAAVMAARRHGTPKRA